MAGSPKTALPLLLVSSSVILAMITPSFSCPTRCETELKWTLYLRQIGKGTERNQVEMVNSSHPIGFGTIVVNNWAVLDAPLPSATVVAHARGIHVQAGQGRDAWFTSLSIVFEGARFNGSAFQAMGITGAEDQWAIVGGTGELARADGTIKHKLIRSTDVENYRQADIHAFYTPAAVKETGTALQ